MRVVGVRRHQEDPGEKPDPGADDERVDEARPVGPAPMASDQKQEAGDERGEDAEVDDVGDRRERQRPAEEPLVVVREHVAADEQRLSGREEIPGCRVRRPVDSSPDDDGDTPAAPIALNTGPALNAFGPNR